MFVELHARSGFSFLEGACVPEELAGACAEFGMPAMAIVDRNGLYGAPRFHMAAKKAGIRAHIGAEVSVSGTDESVPRRGACAAWTDVPGSQVLLAETREGYQNLCRLITRMKLRAKKGEGAATIEELAEFSRGLVCLTRNPAERLLDIYGCGNVYAEIQRHFHREEEARNQAIVERARRLGMPLVAANNPACATPAQRELLDVFTCIRKKTTLAKAGRLLERNSERHVKRPEEMERLFRDLPDAIGGAMEISSRLQFTLADLGYEFPRYPTPGGESQISFLRKRVEEGARRRYQPYHERARRQMERELALIEKLKLAGYFLIVWDIVRFCKENGILAQGRGSAANSAVCYALEITAVDPVGMELLFERFLSEERGEWPDIDIDLPSGEKRERAIQYVYQRFGQLGAAMTANVITYRGRSAAREVGKALGFEITTLEKLAGLVHHWEWKDPKDTSENQFAQAGFDLNHPRVRKFFELYRLAQDMPRHLGQHSGGMVVCQNRLDSVVPLEPATMPGRVVVQWDKEDCADLGIIKVDLLGLGMMAVLEDCLKLIPEAYGGQVDLAHLPQNDPAIFRALQKADTIGMFQVESRAQMSCLPRMKPLTFYDIVVQVAIIRPGPIVGKMVHPYLNRRQGREAPDCLHPSLEPVLRRTLGVPLFQEQLLRMAMTVAGFTGGQAEELRRAMGFKRSEKRMAEIEVKLRAGMSRNGITGATQEAIVRSITSFALYGFPESHAASFALIAYASAYLKCHYLAAFTCAMLNNQPMGFYAPAILIKDAQRHGLRVLPVDVSLSDWDCTVEWGRPPACLPENAEAIEHNHPLSHGADAGAFAGEASFAAPPANRPPGPALRLGLRYARGLREEAARAILRARPFTSIDDLAPRVPELRKDEINRLAEIGALNSLRAEHRRDALWKSQRAVRPVGPLLESLEETGGASPLARMNTEERLRADYHGAGLTIGKHPMAYRREEMDARGVTPAAELANVPNGRLVRIAGSVVVRQRPGTAKGFVFLSMEDETGIMNAIVAPPVYDRYKVALLSEPFLSILGTLQNLDGVISVKASRVEALRAGAAASSHDFH
ncbi:MAG TPA: error-prone DNA polymerase [Bryobacteraceae bacterium]|nr:error-prone DNA polymerase [Bryobacteraceae bacterium]